MKSKGGKDGHHHVNAEFQRLEKRGNKDFLGDQCQEIEKNNRIEKTIEISSTKLEIAREHLIQK